MTVTPWYDGSWLAIGQRCLPTPECRQSATQKRVLLVKRCPAPSRSALGSFARPPVPRQLLGRDDGVTTISSAGGKRRPTWHRGPEPCWSRFIRRHLPIVAP